jgi:diacylglycerol kinase family enzyme
VIAFVIANPGAAAANPRNRDALICTLREVAHVEVAHTTARGDATTLARDVMRSRSADVVIAVGGDGTVNEVANGLLADGVHGHIPDLGVAPAGGTNVFLRSLGMPNDFDMAVAKLRESLRSGERRVINVGQVDERYFVFCAGIGLDAAIIGHMEELRNEGRQSSLQLAMGTAVRHLFFKDWPLLKLRLPGSPTADGLRWVVVANSDPWTFVNSRPLRPTPLASFDLGMDIYARRNMMPLGLLWSALRMYQQAPHSEDKGIYCQHDVSSFSILADDSVPVHVDGDMLGRRHCLEFRNVQQALNIVAPTPIR